MPLQFRIEKTKSGRFVACLRASGKRHVSLGTWATKKLAERACDRAALFLSLPPKDPESADWLGAASPERLQHAARQAARRQTHGTRYAGVKKADHGWTMTATVAGQTVRVHVATEQLAAETYDRLLAWAATPRRHWNFPDREADPLGPDDLVRVPRVPLGEGPYIGVSLHRQSGLWRALVYTPNRQVSLKYHEDPIEAALVRDRAALKLKWRDAALNFPDKLQRHLPKRTPRPVADAAATRFAGVEFDPKDCRWVARADHGPARKRPLGRFDDEWEAAQARDRYLDEHGVQRIARNIPHPLRPTAESRVGVRPRGRRYEATLREGAGTPHALGLWPTVLQAELAHDRAALYLDSHRPLNHPQLADEVGAASPRALRAEARSAASAPAPEPATPLGRKRRAKGEGPRSEFRGVVWEPGQRCWRAVMWRPRRMHLGYWEHEEEAARAHDQVCLHFGRRDTLNFPFEDLSPARPEQVRATARALARQRAGASSQFNGVRARDDGRWSAFVRIDGTLRSLGSYDSEETAARAHDRAARQHLGLRARLNFP